MFPKKVIGLVPAAGQATRLGRLPCSKEILPIYAGLAHPPGTAPRVIGEYLLRGFRDAGITKTFFILRPGKWDIMEYFGHGGSLGLHIGYLLIEHPYGIPFTLDAAYPFIQDAWIALGFPDMHFQPSSCYQQLLKKLTTSSADVVLGLFPIDNPKKWDMVEVEENGSLRDIKIKQQHCDLQYGWAMAVWRPTFTSFMHKFLTDILQTGGTGQVVGEDGSSRELYPGDIFLAAKQNGLRITTLCFAEGFCTDIGTPEDVPGLDIS